MSEAQFLIPPSASHTPTVTLKTVFSFVFLDIILIGLLWLIFVMINQERVSFKSEISHYSFKTSLFDFACLSVMRGLFICIWFVRVKRHIFKFLFFLAIGTTVMIIMKILKYYMFTNFSVTYNQSLTFAITILLISFSLSWLYLWKLSLYVPKDQDVMSRAEDLSKIQTVQDWINAAETESFHTAWTGFRREPQTFEELPNMEEEKSVLWGSVLPLFQSASGWTLSSDDGRVAIFVQTHPEFGHIVCGRSIISAGFDQICRELIDNVVEIPKWDLLTDRISRTPISENSDLVIVLTKKAVGGIVKPRVFSTFRTWFYTREPSTSSCTLCSVSADTGALRGTRGKINYGTGFHVTSGDSFCHLSVFFNIDLNMPLPTFLKNKEMVKYTRAYLESFKAHIEPK